nr:hypothetical protein [Enterococcus faecium]
MLLHVVIIFFLSLLKKSEQISLKKLNNLAPGILGVVHVLFGLQMFGLFMQNPYKNIWAPFTIFFVLYFIYYVLTTWLYTRIVLQDKNK